MSTTISALSDPKLISEYHQEYLKLINTYDSFKRPSIFVKYFNINYDMSTRRSDTDTTFDIYNKSGIVFDIYDLTPTYNIAPVVNASSFSMEKKGQMFEGVSSIVTHTIHTPRIDDLISFYSPIKSEEIFRVNNLRAVINAIYSNPPVEWYELDLETAPIMTTDNLKIYNHYVYDIHDKKYLLYDDYKRKTILLSRVNELISQFKKYYSKIYDCYFIKRTEVPLITNQIILDFKNKFRNTWMFGELAKPYSFENVIKSDPRYPTEEPEYDHIHVYDLIKKEFKQIIKESNVTTILEITEELKNIMKDL